MIISALFAVIFLGVGLTLYFISKEYHEISVRYDNRCTVGQLCRVQFDVEMHH